MNMSVAQPSMEIKPSVEMKHDNNILNMSVAQPSVEINSNYCDTNVNVEIGGGVQGSQACGNQMISTCVYVGRDAIGQETTNQEIELRCSTTFDNAKGGTYSGSKVRGTDASSFGIFTPRKGRGVVSEAQAKFKNIYTPEKLKNI